MAQSDNQISVILICRHTVHTIITNGSNSTLGKLLNISQADLCQSGQTINHMNTTESTLEVIFDRTKEQDIEHDLLI